MKTIEIHDHPIALILQIDPSTHQLVEAVLKTEFEMQGHTGVRDIWLKDLSEENKSLLQSAIDKAISDAL